MNLIEFLKLNIKSIIIIIAVAVVVVSGALIANYSLSQVKENTKKIVGQALKIGAPRPSFLTTDDNGNLSKFDPSGEEKLNNDFRIEGKMEADEMKINGNLIANAVNISNNNNTIGSISMNQGDGANDGRNAGFINFNYKDGKRKAYMGFDDLDNNMVALEGENGCNGFHIKGGVNGTGNLTVDNLVETKQLNIKTTNDAGGTHLNWPADGKNYLTGETIVRGGNLIVNSNIKMIEGSKITVGNGFFEHDTSNGGMIYEGGPFTIKNTARIKSGQQICIGNTCIDESDLQFLKKIQTKVKIYNINSNQYLKFGGGQNVVLDGDWDNDFKMI